MTCALSIVLPTYNRADDLPRAVESALNQSADPRAYEVIVVDNNSTDDTQRVLERLGVSHPRRLRVVHERRQGVAYARNAGIALAQAPVVAFFDDDVRVTTNWVDTILRAFGTYGQVDCLGGKVLPVWRAAPPPWLTREHWAPLALQDFGDQTMLVSSENPRGLISANLACRKPLLDRVGGFAPQFQRVKDGIGSLEDDEWIRRVWKSGGEGLYVPDLISYTDVPEDRLTRAYHRRWHGGHGRFYALLRADEMERSSMGSFLGVPAHMYRSALRDATGWISSVLKRETDRMFTHEVKLRFFRGFLSQRILERRFS